MCVCARWHTATAILVHGADQLAICPKLGHIIVACLDAHRPAGQVKQARVLAHVRGATTVVDLHAVESLCIKDNHS